jgi:hypothetical protein
MLQEKCKLLLICIKVIFLAILTAAIYVGSYVLLSGPIDLLISKGVSTLVAFVVILGFDVFWIVLMKLWPLRKIHVKIVLTLIVFAVSASILTCFVVVPVLRDAFM